MKAFLLLAVFALSIPHPALGAPNLPPWENKPLELVKSCSRGDFSELSFWVKKKSGNADFDLFQGELSVKAVFNNLQVEGASRKVQIWLHYRSVPKRNARVFPESAPDEVVIHTMGGFFPWITGTWNEVPGGKVENLWKELRKSAVASWLTFIEDCVYFKGD